MAQTNEVILVVRTARALAESVGVVTKQFPAAEVIGLSISDMRKLDAQDPTLADSEGVIFTSVSGVEAGPYPLGRDNPVWCVNTVTAEAARTAGWRVAGHGTGDGHAMARMMAGQERPRQWRHWCSEDAGTEWYRHLQEMGHTVSHAPVYRMQYTRHLPAAVAAALTSGRWRRTLLLSAESARCLRELLETAKVEPKGSLYALSEGIAAAAPLFNRVVVAAVPTWAALLASLTADEQHIS